MSNQGAKLDKLKEKNILKQIKQLNKTIMKGKGNKLQPIHTPESINDLHDRLKKN